MHRRSAGEAADGLQCERSSCAVDSLSNGTLLVAHARENILCPLNERQQCTFLTLFPTIRCSCALTASVRLDRTMAFKGVAKIFALLLCVLLLCNTFSHADAAAVQPGELADVKQGSTMHKHIEVLVDGCEQTAAVAAFYLLVYLLSLRKYTLLAVHSLMSAGHDLRFSTISLSFQR